MANVVSKCKKCGGAINSDGVCSRCGAMVEKYPMPKKKAKSPAQKAKGGNKY